MLVPRKLNSWHIYAVSTAHIA